MRTYHIFENGKSIEFFDNLLDCVIEFERWNNRPERGNTYAIVETIKNNNREKILTVNLLPSDIAKHLQNLYGFPTLRDIGDHVHLMSSPMTNVRSAWGDSRTRAAYYIMLWSIRAKEQ